MRAIDETGKRFGRLTVTKMLSKRSVHGKRRCACVCDCGVKIIVVANDLRNGDSKSCGCFKTDIVRKVNITHGERRNGGTPEYNAWISMIRRCENPNYKNFKYWGGRGISVCSEWRHDFPRFLNDVGRKPSPRHSLDRYPNVNGNYEPGNVRWANRYQQNTNQRRNHERFR